MLCVPHSQVMTVLHAKPGFFWTLLINSCMAYAVNLTNFMVTKYTSALTLQVRHITHTQGFCGFAANCSSVGCILDSAC